MVQVDVGGSLVIISEEDEWVSIYIRAVPERGGPLVHTQRFNVLQHEL
jgi:hypothetical protein